MSEPRKVRTRGFSRLNGVSECLECGQSLTSPGCHYFGTAAGGGTIPRWHYAPATPRPEPQPEPMPSEQEDK